MEVATCQHKEQIEVIGGVEIGTCSICHQEIKYEGSGVWRIAIVTRLGRIDGRVVLPKPKNRLLLSKEDKHDLKVARGDVDLARGGVDPSSLPTCRRCGRKYQAGLTKKGTPDLREARCWVCMGYAPESRGRREAYNADGTRVIKWSENYLEKSRRPGQLKYL